MKYIFILLITFLLVCSIKAQNFRPPVQYLVDSIARMTSIPIGLFSFQDTFIFDLDSIATTKELLQLTDHPAPIVRARVVFILLDKVAKDTLLDIDFLDLFVHHLFDTARVRFKIFDSNSTHHSYDRILSLSSLYAQKIGGYFGRTTLYLPGKNPSVSDADKHLMDSLILCQQVPLVEEKERLVLSLDTFSSFYPKIKEQVLQFKDEDALIYLAKYQKEADVNLILTHLPTSKSSHGVWKYWLPFHFFHHPLMFQFLKAKLDTYWKDSRFMACIAQYQSKEAADLLSEIYANAKNEEKTHRLKTSVRRAINRYYSQPYADLYVTILSENEPFGYLNLPDELWEHQGDTLFHFYEKWKKSNDKWAGRYAQSLFPKAKEYVEENYPERVAEVVFQQIQTGADYLKYARSFYYIKQSKNIVFIDPLFSLLKEEPKADNRFFIIKILMSFKNQTVNEQLEAFFVEYPESIPTIKEAEAGARLYKALDYYATRKKY